MKKSFTAWAIDTNYTDIDGSYRPGFIGLYHWVDGSPPQIPPTLEGCRVALFKTREIARKILRADKSHPYRANPDARVVKVFVTVRT